MYNNNKYFKITLFHQIHVHPAKSVLTQNLLFFFQTWNPLFMYLHLFSPCVLYFILMFLQLIYFYISGLRERGRPKTNYNRGITRWGGQALSHSQWYTLYRTHDLQELCRRYRRIYARLVMGTRPMVPLSNR